MVSSSFVASIKIHKGKRLKVYNADFELFSRDVIFCVKKKQVVQEKAFQEFPRDSFFLMERTLRLKCCNASWREITSKEF